MSKKSPQLRFEGFTDDWEERKLSELIQKGGSGGTPKSTNKTYYDGDIPFLGISDISKSNGYIDDTEKHISEKGLNNSSAWIVPKGAISLAMYASVGKLAILNIDAATSQAFYNMVFEYESIRDYVYHRLGRANDLGEWTKLISTGTQANLNADKVKNFEIQVPQSIDEMKDISTFFNQLDIFITLQQRKLDLLKEQKKGFLQKMFPQNGAKVPELRFAGFADDWELRKLGTLVEELNENISGVSGFPIATSSRKGLFLQNEYFSGERTGIDKNINFHKVPVGYITYRHMSDDSIFKFNKNSFETPVLVSKEYPVFKSNSNSDQEFLLIHLNNSPLFLKFSTMQKLGGTRVRLYFKNLKTYELYAPTFEEQKQIGSFFSLLNHTITLHQRKLDLLKEQKKGFLQKMFV